MERVIPWTIFTLLMTGACFWRPRPMRGVMGVFFALMGLGVHGAFVIIDPVKYIAFARQSLIPLYGRIAEAVIVGVTPVAFGLAMLVFELTLAVLMLGSGQHARLALIAAGVFLVGITPLGAEVLPNAILAVGVWKLAREHYRRNVLAEFRDWRAARRHSRAELHTTSMTTEPRPKFQ
jgi:hypothetical protein